MLSGLSAKISNLHPVFSFLFKPWVMATLSFSAMTVFFLAPLAPLFSVYQGQVMLKDPPRSVGTHEDSWTSYQELSPHLIYAILSAEDSRFFQHRGMDYREIWLSLHQNIRRRAYHRGGSTITQQLVKLVTGQKQKTLIRKLREIIGASLLEATLSKEEILTWYLNLVHFGSYAYGIKAAAEHYFNTTPSRLTLNQSIHLALILPGPNSWSQGLKLRSLTEFGRKRFARLLREMYNNHYITRRQYVTAIQTANFGKPLSPY